MDRFDFFFRQKVTEAELDAAFDAVEQAILRAMLDNGIVGITSGGQVTENAGTPNLTVDVAGPCTIYDQLGQRVSWSATQDLDTSVDENSNATAVGSAGNEKWLSVFAQFKRVFSDNRLDGEGASIQFNQAEGFELHVVQGAEAPTGTATRPPLRGDEILLDDILITFGHTQILNADIDDTRREWAFKTTSGVAVAVGTAEEAVQALATAISGGGADLTAHKAAISGVEHDARALQFVGGSNSWHDSSFYATQSVYAIIDQIIFDLADAGSIGQGGGDRIGCEGFSQGGVTLANGSLRDMLVEVAAEIDELKKGRLAMQASAMTFRVDPGDTDSSAPANAIAFATEGQSDGHPQILIVGGTTTATLWGMDGIVTGGYDRTSRLVGTPYVMNDILWLPGVGANGGRFVAVGELAGNTGADIQYNDDVIGFNWTQVTATGMTTATDAARHIIQDPDTGDLIVIGDNGKIIRSTDDGVTWVAASSIPAGVGTKEPRAIGVSPAGDIIAIFSDGSNGVVIHSDDGGDTWSDVTPGDFVRAGVCFVVWEPTASRFVFSAIGSGGQGYIWRSTNVTGSAWLRNDLYNSNGSCACTDGSGRILMFKGNGEVLITDDLGVTVHQTNQFENNAQGRTHYTTEQWENSWAGNPSRAYHVYGRIFLVDGFLTGFWVSPSYGPGRHRAENAP